MYFRDLAQKDFAELSNFILHIYKGVPESMWFDNAPDKAELRKMFDSKISKLKNNEIVDIVAFDGDRIIGECEIVKTVKDIGYIGLLVRDGYRRKGLASALFKDSAERAKSIGINRLQAEIGTENVPAQNFFSKIGFTRHGKVNTITFGGQQLEVMLLEKLI